MSAPADLVARASSLIARAGVLLDQNRALRADHRAAAAAVRVLADAIGDRPLSDEWRLKWRLAVGAAETLAARRSQILDQVAAHQEEAREVMEEARRGAGEP